jgi:hypothetical protein
VGCNYRDYTYLWQVLTDRHSWLPLPEAEEGVKTKRLADAWVKVAVIQGYQFVKMPQWFFITRYYLMW